jgi:hypothetical protein
MAKLTAAQKDILNVLRDGGKFYRRFGMNTALLVTPTGETRQIRPQTYKPLVGEHLRIELEDESFAFLLTVAKGGKFATPPCGWDAIRDEISMLMHAGRDSMRNCEEDTSKYFLSPRNSYYAEAFGIVRACVLMGYGKYGAVNVPDNLQYWFAQIEEGVKNEENFVAGGPPGKCAWCTQKYGKDDFSVTQKKGSNQ